MVVIQRLNGRKVAFRIVKKGIWEIRNSNKFSSLLQKMHKAEVDRKIRQKNEEFILEKNSVLIKSGKNNKEKSYVDWEHKFIRIK